ncbi:hypothetical protein ACOMHN_044263 [Nucella lapillus]
MSDVMASVNKTHHIFGNGTSLWAASTSYLSAPGTWPGAGDHWMSLAFVNFVLALLAFSIRYAAIFWYTNKALTLVFALQLFTLTLTALLGYSAFTCLYKVCSNQHLFLNVHLALPCPLALTLYLLGSTAMLLSTFIVCEYGSRYFMEKMRIIERRHRKLDLEASLRLRTGCQVYVPHMCALAALAFLVSCKGPVMYDLVRVYRPTQDALVLTGLVCEVLYMVLWIGLWFALTVKQQWQFRILDYMSLGQSLDSGHLEDEVIRRSTLGGHRGSRDDDCFDMEMQDLGSSTCPQNRDSSYRDSLFKSQEASYVSFLPNGGVCGTRDKARSLPNGRKSSHSSHLSVQAEMHISHNLSPQAAAAGPTSRSRHCSGEGSTSQGGSSLEKQRRKDGHTDSFRDYRNSIRSKCDDLYTTVEHRREEGGEDKVSLVSDPPCAFSPNVGLSPHDALPTLMSSFRDKVKESSRAANNYRQQRCSLKMGGGYASLEKDGRKDHARRVHIRNGSWTPTIHNSAHSSLERDSRKDRTHVRSSSWTHQAVSTTSRQNDSQASPHTKNEAKPGRPLRPSSAQGNEGSAWRQKQQTHKSHSLPHSRQRQWPNSRGRPRNNSLPSTPRRLQQVHAAYSLADQMARLRGNRGNAPRGDAPSPGWSRPCSAASLPGSITLNLPHHADLASCPFMTSRATSTND